MAPPALSALFIFDTPTLWVCVEGGCSLEKPCSLWCCFWFGSGSAASFFMPPMFEVLF